MCEIEKYNNNLVNSKTIITIIDYVKAVNRLKYKIDIDFIDEFIENDDYRVRKVSESKSGGCTHKNEYYLHPRAFKICLMRSLKTKKYAKYYLLLEECIKYFNEYQIELNKKYTIHLSDKIKEKDIMLVQKDDKIDELDKNIKELLINNKKILKDNQEMKKMLDKTFNKLVGAHEEIKDIKDKLDNTEEELHTVNDKLDNTTEELDVIKDKLDIATDDRVVKTKSKTILEYLIVLKTTDIEEKYKYYIIRCQKRSIKQRLEEKSNYTEIKRIECCLNSTNLYNRIKKRLENNLDVRSNRINLINMQEADFLHKINEINEEKKII
jgi:hypothetical protein